MRDEAHVARPVVLEGSFMFRFISVAVATVIASTAIAQEFFLPVNLLPFVNDRLQTRSTSFPAQNPVLGGVPFRIEPTGNNMWSANVASGANPRVLTVPINVEGVREVHTLINTDWGQTGPESVASVQFETASGLVHTVSLVGGVDIRDWNQNTFTNTINGTTTTQVVTAGTARVDKQRITLPSAFAGEELRRIRFIDTGATNQQRIFVAGLTLVINQPSDRVWSPLIGGNGHRYRAVQAVNGVTWTQAHGLAEQMGGYLATITSVSENAFVFASLGGNQAFWFANEAGAGVGPWLGGVQNAGSVEPAGGWAWVTNEPFVYSNWAFGEPNNLNGNEDRIHFFAPSTPANSLWNDASSTAITRGFIVEFDSACDDIDFNNNGVFPEDQDLFDFFGVLAGEECGSCNDIDFNNNSVFPEDQDIQDFLTVLAGGQC